MSHLHQLTSLLRRQLLGRGKPQGAHYWDGSFSAGQWAHLDGLPESARFAALTRLISHHHQNDSAILDVGCGAGTLYRYLSRERQPLYIGSDISAEALTQARRTCSPSTLLLHEPADRFTMSAAADGGPYGVIVLSEVLHYIDDPFATLRHFRRLLIPHGVLIISIWNPWRHAVLRWRLHRQLRVLASEVISCPSGSAWELTVAR